MKRICNIEDDENSTTITESVVTVKRTRDMEKDSEVSESVATAIK